LTFTVTVSCRTIQILENMQNNRPTKLSFHTTFLQEASYKTFSKNVFHDKYLSSVFNFIFSFSRGFINKYEMRENIYVQYFSVMHIFSKSANCPLSPSLKCILIASMYVVTLRSYYIFSCTALNKRLTSLND